MVRLFSGELENITLALHGKGHRNFHLTSNIDFMLDEFKERQKTAVKSNEHCQTSLLSRKQYVRVSLRNELDFESVQSYNLILLINSGKFTVSVPVSSHTLSQTCNH